MGTRELSVRDEPAYQSPQAPPKPTGHTHQTWGRPRDEDARLPPMDTDRFWQLIDQARAAAGPEADRAVRDDDLLDEDPDHDYWDFDDEDLRALVQGDADLND